MNYNFFCNSIPKQVIEIEIIFATYKRLIIIQLHTIQGAARQDHTLASCFHKSESREQLF